MCFSPPWTEGRALHVITAMNPNYGCFGVGLGIGLGFQFEFRARTWKVPVTTKFVSMFSSIPGCRKACIAKGSCSLEQTATGDYGGPGTSQDVPVS